MRSMTMILVFLLSLTACQKASVSSVQSLYGQLDIKLIDSKERAGDPWAGAVGAMVYGSSDTIAFLENGSDCSGIAISPELVLTAGHCQQYAPFGYVFNQQKTAKDKEAASVTISDAAELRLEFHGLLDPAAEDAILAPAWLTQVYRDSKRDFALYRRPVPIEGPTINIFADASAEGHLALYGYPNGLPLTVATHCRGIKGSSGTDVWHDCDSLGGSSGALLINSDEQKPLGLHHMGGGVNSAELYRNRQHFESADEMAERSLAFWQNAAQDRDRLRAQDFWNCSAKEKADAASCLVAHGLNRALLFSEIRERLRTEAPALYAEIRDGALDGHDDVSPISSPQVL